MKETLGLCPPLPIPASVAAVGRGSRAPRPSPGLAGVAAGVSPVASGRSCQSGQGETPPHTNVASQRAYATLDRASATWTTLHHPWSLSWRLHPLISVLPKPQRPQAGVPRKTQWHRLSPVHHCRACSCQEELMVVPKSWGECGKKFPRAAGLESVEVLRVSLSLLYTLWFSSLGYGCKMQ